MFDVLSVGNALIDAFLSIHEASEFCSVDPADHSLRIVSGEKINLESSQFLLGGNAANVAVGLSRLGLKSAIAAETGNDEFTQKIIHGLTQERVDTALLKQTDAPSSFAIALNFKGERTLFVQHVARRHEFAFANIDTKWFYLTSLGNAWEEAYMRVSEVIKTGKTALAFNPGSLQLAEGVESFRYLLPLTTILFVNKEEAEEIAGEKPASIELLLKKTKAEGPQCVVLTDGENGSYIITNDGEMYHCGLYPARCVERTGAGDAYAGAFLAAVIHGQTSMEAMRHGAANSAAVIEQTGAEVGLLAERKMQEKLAAHELPVRQLH